MLWFGFTCGDDTRMDLIKKYLNIQNGSGSTNKTASQLKGFESFFVSCESLGVCGLRKLTFATIF